MVISVSVVSHNQINLIANLLNDLNKYCSESSIELILTLNLNEPIPFPIEKFFFPIKIIRNSIPLGFGANHNQAFAKATGHFFCIINPDIRLMGNPFNALLKCLHNPKIALVAPLVSSSKGDIEDSARSFPTPLTILARLFRRNRKGSYVVNNVKIYPDWVGGMFMVLPYSTFQKVSGFNERFFLYYEDVDLCARLRLLGYEVALCPSVKVIHDAQRSSHSNLKYLKWHLSSMLQFFCSRVYIKVLWQKFKGNFF